MEPWTRAIIEWLNCLGVHKTRIKNPGDLQNKDIYKNIISQLTDDPPSSIPYEQVSNFLKKEYPEFLLHHNPTEKNQDHVYIASLLLLSISQNPAFQRPMCNLRNDTQIIIKKYLENLLPYGNTITREILTSTISGLSDSTLQTPPVTPKDHPLRNFFTSPAAHTAQRHKILNEKTREIRELKAELETIKYEKNDLQEDLKNREEKIENLQKKLNDKNQELKALKAERWKPLTPQSTRKNKKSDGEGIFKREIQQLEDFNATLQKQLDSLEDEKEELSRRLISKERLNQGLKDKVEIYDRNLESLGIQLNKKSSELLDLRLQNEELRSHIKDMQRCSLNDDQSFEIDSVSRAQSPTSGLNTSEALSTIVDIQLQEAREESLKLKLQVDSLHLRLDEALKNCQELENVREILKVREIELIEGNNKLTIYEDEKMILERDLEIIRNELSDKNIILRETDDNCKSLNFKIENQLSVITKINKQVEELNSSLMKQNNELIKITGEKGILENDLDVSMKKIEELNSEILRYSKISESSGERIGILEEKIGFMEMEREKLKGEINEKTIDLEKTLDTLNDKLITIDLLNSRVEQLKDYGNAQDIKLKGLEMNICELNELKEELQSQIDEEKRNLMRVTLENDNLKVNLMTIDDEKKNLMDQLMKLKSDHEGMRVKAEQLDKQNRNNEEKYLNASEKIKILEEESERLNLKISTAISDISQLKELQENLENQLTQEQESSMKLITEKSILEHKLSTKNRENCDLSQKVTHLDAELNKTLQELQDLENHHRDLNGTHQETLEKLQKLEFEVLKANDDIKKCNSEIYDMKLLIDDLECQLKVKKTKIESLLDEKITLENRLSCSDGEREILLEKLSKLEDSLNNSEKIIEKIQKKSDEFEFLCEKREKIIDDQQNELLELKKIHEILKNEFDGEKNNLMEKLTKSLEEIEESERKNWEAVEKINLMNFEIKKLNSDLKSADFDRGSLQNDVTRLSDDILELKRTKEALENQLKLVNESNEELSNEKSTLIDELLNLKQHNNNLFDSLSSNERELTESGKKIEELKIYSDDLQEKCKKSTEKINSMTSEIEKLTLKLENTILQRDSLDNNLKNLNDEFMSEKLSLNAELLDLKRENDDLSEKLKSRDTEFQQKEREFIEKIDLLNSQIENLNLNLQKMISERDSFHNDLAQVQNRLRNSDIQLNSQHEFIETLKTEKSSLNSELSELKRENENLLLNLTLNEGKSQESTKKIEQLQSYCEDLQEKLTKSVKKITFLTSKIDNSSLKLTEMITSRDSLQNNLTKVTEELEIIKLQSKDYQRKLEESKEMMENSKKRHEDQENVSKELIKSLEKRLLASENTHKTSEVNEKLKQETITILQSKLEELTKEKIESEFKLKEIILNLQEIRGSQDAVMETQSKALAQKNNDLEALEKEHLSVKKALEDKINHQELRATELSSELELLKKTHDNSSKTIEDLQETLKIEKERLIFLNQQLYKTEEEKSKITEISKILSSRLSNLISIIKNEPIDPIIHEEKEPEEIDEIFDDPDIQELSKTVKNLVKSTKLSEEILLSFLEEKEKLLKEFEEVKINYEQVIKEKLKTQELTESVSFLISQKQELQGLLNDVIASRDEIDKTLSSLRHSWTQISLEKQSLLMESSSACDEVKHLDVKKTEIEELINKINENNFNSFQPLIKCLSRVFSWSNHQLEEFSSRIILKEDEKSDPEDVKIDLIAEESLLKSQLNNNNDIKEDLILIERRINEFKEELISYEANLKSGVVKREPTSEEKLQNQVDRLNREKKEIKDKLDAMRVRNAKMEKNMDELRSENKKIKSDTSDIEKFEVIIDDLRRENEELKKIKDELMKKSNDDNFDDKLKEIHNEYGQKLERIKEKMKIAYNEQATKMQIEQERIIREKTAVMKEKMEAQCRKYVEDIDKYKAHVKDMSSQYWDVGEKLLAEKQEKETALLRLRELQRKHQIAIAEASHQFLGSQSQMRSANLDRGFDHDRSDFGVRAGYRAVQVIEEQTTTRRHSVKSIQAMGNAFKAEDEDEIFDNVYLADLKEGQFRAIEPQTDFDRLSELRMRNSLCRPHLKSSYAVETHLHPVTLTEEDIKSGPHEDLFNDSLSQSLLPGQKVKKRDRTQTSYKRPGPPTPSKNGGRLSLQGNEYKSPNSRILRDKNGDRRTTTTPKRLKDFFGTSLSKRHDENAPGTPKGRRLSHIFRKPKTERS